MNGTTNRVRPLFPGQQPDEKIYLIIRRHWIVLAKQILVWLLFAALLLGIDGYLVPMFPTLQIAPYSEILAIIRSVYLMFLIAALFSIWILYYLNYQIITNERIVDVSQKNLLNHTTAEFHLSRTQDVTAEIKGVLGNFLNFGNVYVQTAAETDRFEFDRVPNPQQVAKLILDLYEQIDKAGQTSGGV
jgi:hypothetical protein